jgi:hypothetical protein
MKTEWSFNNTRTLLVSLCLGACGAATALGQDAVYPALVSSTSDTVWDAPFYWIDHGDYSPYGRSTSHKSTATDPVGTPTRLGSYWHTANSLSVGEGFGLVHVNGLQAGAVYEVQVTQPSYQLATDIIMNVGSTNCDIGGVFGATAGGGWTNTTAFQAAYSKNLWARVCYLTNRPGVTQPHIDFKYVSGGTGSQETYADCVRFHLLSYDPNAPAPVRITDFDYGNPLSLAYTGGAGARFILLSSTNPRTPPDNWDRLATNYATPSSFPLSPVGLSASAFFRIQSE